MAQPKRCHQCWSSTEPADLIGGLFCSTRCQQVHEEQHDEAKDALLEAGFVQNPDVPNLYVKDGVNVSIEEVRYAGMDQTLARHRLSVKASK